MAVSTDLGNYIVTGMDSLGLQIDVNLSEATNYTILPASAVNPRNVSSEPVTQPPHREMRERYVARTGNINDVNKTDSKKTVQRWKTENKNIYGTKVVWKFSCFPLRVLIMTHATLVEL